MYCGSGLTEENCQCGVVCALRIREAIPFSLENEMYLYLIEVVEEIWIDADLQLFGLNPVILITAWVES